MRLTLFILGIAWAALLVGGCGTARPFAEQDAVAEDPTPSAEAEVAEVASAEPEAPAPEVVSSADNDAVLTPPPSDAPADLDDVAIESPAARAVPPTAMAYPGNAPLGRDLDIVVRQGRRTLTLINRQPEVIEDMELWINQQYVTRLDRIVIGDGNTVSFRDLLNRHGEHYPTPTLLTPENAYPAVLAELFDPREGRRHRLVARPRANLLVR